MAPQSASLANALVVEEDAELDEKYPHRPRNHGQTLPFHDLYLTLFDPLSQSKKTSTKQAKTRHRGPFFPSTKDTRLGIIARFISRWRSEVGNDIYPAFRLILPEKDRERPMYGIKEHVIAKILIRLMKINKDSEDGQLLRNWKQPGQTSTGQMAGDFAGRCYKIISKRPMRIQPGNMRIEKVNELLDQLALSTGQDSQAEILAQFYERMNAEEMQWLVRIILRQMKIGATERTIFNIWHPDAENIFSISSSLRRVCWELFDPKVRLQDGQKDVTLMQCFQPQLAQFQMHSIRKMIDRMDVTLEDPIFWIEEKLDGERMQLHMKRETADLNNKTFKFWSRKAKDYTELYGASLTDGRSALTRHLYNAFHDRVDSIVLDGEMITWDMEEDAIAPFGTLKTAAKEQQDSPSSHGQRPVYKVFDILYLNGCILTNFTLRDRRKALHGAVRNVSRRLEIHEYIEAKEVHQVETMLRSVIASGSEGLLMKNPRSAYHLNSRNDDWMKIKPEYMAEFGESLDCVILGGYYGSGHRGGKLSSFLCGLRIDNNDDSQVETPMHFHSFFKVGGGFTSNDYATIRHKTDGNWHNWDVRHPPSEYITLAGGDKQFERPDQWIIPADSVVIEVKAASTAASESFRMGFTLRFPRFKRIREDRTWKDALSITEFLRIKKDAEEEKKEKEFRIDDSRKRTRINLKKPLIIANTGHKSPTETQNQGLLFQGLLFYVMTGAAKPDNFSKSELENIVTARAGSICSNAKALSTICIGERKTVQVASVIKQDQHKIIRPSWILDCVRQQSYAESSRFLLPLEPRHLFHPLQGDEVVAARNVDRYGDSFARDVDTFELRTILETMDSPPKGECKLRSNIVEGVPLDDIVDEHRGSLFQRMRIYIASVLWKHPGAEQLEIKTANLEKGIQYLHYGGASICESLDERTTHVLCDTGRVLPDEIRSQMFGLRRLPRQITVHWIEQCWKERTVLDEERQL